MTEYDLIVKRITDIAALEAGVKAVHSPATSAGEKIIYRYTPGSYDGDYEVITVTMRFISKDIQTAVKRMENVSRVLCSEGTRNPLSDGECPVYVTRKHSGGSGYIGKTGHFFVLAAFEVKRQMPSAIKYAEGEVM